MTEVVRSLVEQARLRRSVFLVDERTSAAVCRVAARYPDWAVPARAINQCRIASGALLHELRGDGIAAKPLWLHGPRGDLRRAQQETRTVVEHLTVLVGLEVVDLTRRQWDAAAAHPMIYSDFQAVAIHWCAHYSPGAEPDDRPRFFD